MKFAQSYRSIFLSAIVLSVLSSFISVAQVRQDDVVYLRNGSTIKGTVLQLHSDSVVAVMIADSTVLQLPMSTVKRIVIQPHEIKTTGSHGRVPIDSSRYGRKTNVFIRAGADFPTGVFKSVTGDEAGYARTGYQFGAEVAIPFSHRSDMIFDVFYVHHFLDEDALKSKFWPFTISEIGSWNITVVAGGVRLGMKSDPGTRLYISGQLGAGFVSSPSLSGSWQSGQFRQPAASASSLVTILGLGLVVEEQMTVGAEFMWLKPKFSVSATATNNGVSTTVSTEEEQPIGLVRVSLGIALF